MILYDISTIGKCYRLGWPRAGISRVVEAGAQGLLEAGLEGLALCASSPADFQGYLDFVRSQGQSWKRAPLLESRRRAMRPVAGVQGRVGAQVAALTQKIGAAPMRQFVPERLSRRALSFAFEAVERSATMLDRDVLRRARLFHSPSDAFPHEVRAVPRLPRIITVYDLIPVLRAEVCTDMQKAWMGGVLRSAQRGGWACAISQATKDDLCEHVRIAPEQVFVTPLAADSRIFYPCDDPERLAAVRKRYAISEGPYLISVCTLEPRKNLDHLVRCFARLAHEPAARDLSLVLVGGKGWMSEKIFEALDEATGDPALSQSLRGRIVLTGYAPDDDLAPLYSGALGFAYLSFYEGFGLPPLEAMQCGVPVITSNTSSLPEVVGDAGILLDPKDADGLCAAILGLCSDTKRREQMAARSLERAAGFSWTRFIQDTTAAYQAVMQGF